MVSPLFIKNGMYTRPKREKTTHTTYWRKQDEFDLERNLEARTV